MTAYDLTPGFVILKYATPFLAHKMTFQVSPNGVVTPGSEPNFNLNAGSFTDMSTCVDALIVKMKALVNADTEFIDATYWDKPTSEDDPLWIYTYQIGVTGTNIADNIETCEQVWTWRTARGHFYRNYIMGVPDLPDLTFHVADLVDPKLAYYTYFGGGGNWILGRDNTPPVSLVSMHTKTNDKLRRQLLVP
jgi:hypothetical protein